jgi:hypothetical protein
MPGENHQQKAGKQKSQYQPQKIYRQMPQFLTGVFNKQGREGPHKGHQQRNQFSKIHRNQFRNKKKPSIRRAQNYKKIWKIYKPVAL